MGIMLQYSQLLQLIVLCFLAAAVVNDLRKREVPNWVNYGLIITGVSLSLLQSIVAADWHFLAFSLAGAAAALAVAALMFYTGQWGGGDSKLLIGIGAMLGLPFSSNAPFISVESPAVSFLLNLVVISVLYATAIGMFMALKKKNRKRFAAAVRKQMAAYSALRKLLLIAAAVGLVIVLAVDDAIIKLGVVALLTALLFGLYLSIMAKAVEMACMLKRVSPLKLTEGDWIANDVIVDGRRICGPKDLGVDERQMRQMVLLYRKGKVRTVLIKEGIPFSPSFLIAYVVTIFFGNVFLTLVR